MEGEGRLPRAGRPGEMDGVARVEIGHRPVRDVLDRGRTHKCVARVQSDGAVLAADVVIGDGMEVRGP